MRNEISENSDGDDRAVGGYEQLRRQALSGDIDGWRLGLGVLQHRGVAAWLQIRKAATAPSPTPAATFPPTATGIDAELVALLASMALAVAARG
ncbi:hypothetical protein A4G29_04330 [Mycobacterium kansasii]|nr:hypothetical protein A4G29_04330 [Mycobacterium kansasii]